MIRGIWLWLAIGLLLGKRLVRPIGPVVLGVRLVPVGLAVRLVVWPGRLVLLRWVPRRWVSWPGRLVVIGVSLKSTRRVLPVASRLLANIGMLGARPLTRWWRSRFSSSASEGHLGRRGYLRRLSGRS